MPSATLKQSSKGAAASTSRAWQALTPALSDWILDAVDSMGFDRMTPVQASTIPLFMGNKDVVVEAVTGSGKTLSFLVPIVERLLRLEEPIKRHHVGAIVISPTRYDFFARRISWISGACTDLFARELATQIYNVLLSLLRFHPPSAAALQLVTAADEASDSDEAPEAAPPPFPSSTLKILPQLLLGGTTPPAQDLAHFLTHSPNLLISTPGRLLELLSSPHVHCPQSSFEVLVLDEADRLLDLGFHNDLTKIVHRLPKQRRTGLFSASVSEAVDQLVRLSLRNPVRIAVKVRGRNGEAEGRTPASLRMTYLTTPPHHKIPALLHLLRDLDPRPQKAIAYVSTCAAVDYFQHVLPSLLSLFHTPTATLNDLQIIPLHGKHSSSIRTKNFSRFLTSTSPMLLLTTDLAARGLDIPSVDVTVQLDPPSDPKAFLHRAGRAGRAGRRGLAVAFLTPGRESDEYPAFLSVRQTPVEPLSPPTAASDDAAAADKVTARIRADVRKDRAIHDKAQRAFVSWVRAYSKHEARSIFRPADVDWNAMAAGWGLLRMPRMPELRTAPADRWAGDHSLGLGLDLDALAYRDAPREAKRLHERTHPEARPAPPKKRTSSAAWSEQTLAREAREERREKRGKKREREREARMGEDEMRRERELQGMLDAIRRQNAATRGQALAVGGMEEEFVGFGD